MVLTTGLSLKKKKKKLLKISLLFKSLHSCCSHENSRHSRVLFASWCFQNLSRLEEAHVVGRAGRCWEIKCLLFFILRLLHPARCLVSLKTEEVGGEQDGSRGRTLLLLSSVTFIISIKKTSSQSGADTKIGSNDK